MKRKTIKYILVTGLLGLTLSLLWHVFSPDHPAPINGPLEMERRKEDEDTADA